MEVIQPIFKGSFQNNQKEINLNLINPYFRQFGKVKNLMLKVKIKTLGKQTLKSSKK